MDLFMSINYSFLLKTITYKVDPWPIFERKYFAFLGVSKNEVVRWWNCPPVRSHEYGSLKFYVNDRDYGYAFEKIYSKFKYKLAVAMTQNDILLIET